MKNKSKFKTLKNGISQPNRLESRVWSLESAICSVDTGVYNVETGVWSLGTGVRRTSWTNCLFMFLYMVWMFSSIFVSCMICTFIIKKAHIVNWSWVIIIQFLCREHIWRGGTQKKAQPEMHKKYFFLSCIFCIAAAAVFYSFSKYCRQQRLRGQYRMDFWTMSVYLLFKLCWWSIILDFQLSFFTVNRFILSWQHVCECFIIFLIIIFIYVIFRIRNYFIYMKVAIIRIV